MEIQIGRLREMHPGLPPELASVMVERAALAFQRSGHSPGVGVAWDCDRAPYEGTFSWPDADMGSVDQHDQNRITEDGAEAVALVLAHRHHEWRVLRRMQREEHADWLLEYHSGDRRELVALEVSGIARRSIWERLSEKLLRVSKTTDVDQRWAGVVGFERPTAALRNVRHEDHEER